MASASASAISDPIQLFQLLETADVEVDQIKALIHENLNETRDPSYLNSLVDLCLTTSYPRCTELLAGIREPHDKHLFDKLNDCLKTANSRQQTLALLSHVVYKYPSWLYKISQHSLLPSLIKLLKTSSEILHLVGAVLIVVTLLPVIPSAVGPFLNDIFDAFTRLAAIHSKRTASIPEVYLMHLHVAIYALFHRLYSMYPCHFIGYMRTYCSGNTREHSQIFAETIKPMLDYVRLHPLLVTASKDIEISKTRWKRMETHDIVVECAKLSLDVVEGTREDCPGPRLSYSCFKPVKEVCELLYPSYGFICPTSKVPADSNEDSIVGMTSRMDPTTINWSPSISCGLSTPPRAHQMSPGATYAEVCGRRVESTGGGTPTAQQSVPPSPRRVETSSPFKFPPICEHPFQSSTVACETCTEVVNQGATGGPMTTLTQVVKKLEEQKISDREELVDTEVASIIGQGSSGRSASAAVHQLPRVVRVPSQWASVSPYLKSLQSTQRSRSFSQGKKGPRRSTMEVADRRIPIITKSRSLPELRTSVLATANESLDSEDVTARLPDSRPSPSVDCESTTAPPLGKGATTDDQLCSTYAHLLPSAFPRLPTSDSRMSKTYSASEPPLFSQLSPSEILDRYIEGCRDVYSKKALMTSNPTDPASKAKSQLDEMGILRGQVQLLHIQLMYERQKREIHAERNRRLLGKTKRAKALEEENIAMKDQMQLQEKEIAQLSWTAMKYRKELQSTNDKKDEELEAVRSKLNTVLHEKNALKESRDDLETELEETRLKVTELRKDVDKLAKELFDTHHDLEAIKSHVSLNETLKREVGRLNKELLLSVEMNQKCQEKIEVLQNSALCDVKLSSLREIYAIEMKGLKETLQSKEAIAECTKARVMELEGMLGKKDKVITEQKRLFKAVKLECDETVKAVEEKYMSRRFICEHLESEILKLHYKLETVAAEKVRRRGSHSRPPTTTTSQPSTSESIARQEIPEATAATVEFSGGGGGARRKTSEPINIEPPSGVKTHRPRKETSPKRHLVAADDQKDVQKTFRDPSPDEFRKEEERLSGALEPIAARSLASIVDYGESALEHERGGVT